MIFTFNKSENDHFNEKLGIKWPSKFWIYSRIDCVFQLVFFCSTRECVTFIFSQTKLIFMFLLTSGVKNFWVGVKNFWRILNIYCGINMVKNLLSSILSYKHIMLIWEEKVDDPKVFYPLLKSFLPPKWMKLFEHDLIGQNMILDGGWMTLFTIIMID